MFKIILLLILFISNIMGKNLQPSFSFEASGGVTDLVVKENILYVATTAGAVDIFDIKNKKIIQTIRLKKIKDFMGDDIDPKIYSVDVSQEKSILICSQGLKGYSEVYEYKNNQIKQLIDIADQKFILRAKYAQKDQFLYALLSNQFFLRDTIKEKDLWGMQVSQSKYSYFALSEDKTYFIVSDESGDLKLHSTKDGKFIKSFKGQNLDNVFQVDVKKGKIITAGQDMKTIVYDQNNGNAYLKEARFLVYSAALSPSGKFGAYSKYENNDVQVFDAVNQNDLFVLQNNKMNISKILFLNDAELFVASDAKKVNFYQLQ